MRGQKSIEKLVHRYFLMGLTNREISKLVELSERTVQRVIKDGRFKERATPQPLGARALELRSKGLTYVAIAKALKCSKTTVYNYLKKQAVGC